MTLLLAGLDTAKRDKQIVLENTHEADIATATKLRGFKPRVGQGHRGGEKAKRGRVQLQLYILLG